MRNSFYSIWDLAKLDCPISYLASELDNIISHSDEQALQHFINLAREKIGSNGLHWLISTLNNADQIDAQKIIRLIVKIIEKNDSIQLARWLCETGTRTFINANGFCWLMSALNHAASFENNQTIAQGISSIVMTLIEKCDSAQLTLGLSEKMVRFDNEDDANGFYYLMSALNNAAFKNKQSTVENICRILTMLIRKCDSIPLTEELAKKRTTGAQININAFYWLMSALNNAAIENNRTNVRQICHIIQLLIKKSNSLQITLALSEKITRNLFFRSNGFHPLVTALRNTVIDGYQENTENMTNIMMRLIKKCDPVHLALGFSEKTTCDNQVYSTGFFQLMATLYDVAFKNNHATVHKICCIIMLLVEKCDSRQLLFGLSEKMNRRNQDNTSGIYWLMFAANVAASKKNQDCMQDIGCILMMLIRQCDATQLIKGFFHILTDSNYSQFYWMMIALLEHNENVIISPKFADFAKFFIVEGKFVLSQLIKHYKKFMFDLLKEKDFFSDQTIQYKQAILFKLTTMLQFHKKDGVIGAISELLGYQPNCLSDFVSLLPNIIKIFQHLMDNPWGELILKLNCIHRYFSNNDHHDNDGSNGIHTDVALTLKILFFKDWLSSYFTKNQKEIFFILQNKVLNLEEVNLLLPKQAATEKLTLDELMDNYVREFNTYLRVIEDAKKDNTQLIPFVRFVIRHHENERYQLSNGSQLGQITESVVRDYAIQSLCYQDVHDTRGKKRVTFFIPNEQEAGGGAASTSQQRAVDAGCSCCCIQ